jgi:signal-transduction protein with cAMP-binding, CBS, and nucleotidyltransferase domain
MIFRGPSLLGFPGAGAKRASENRPTKGLRIAGFRIAAPAVVSIDRTEKEIPMSVGRICSREVQLATIDESVAFASRRMRDQNVGTLVVIDEHKKPIGIVTDRDLVTRVMAAGQDPHACSVGEIMTRSPKSLRDDAPIEDALVQMCGLGIRRMLVVDMESCLVGIVSIDDILSLLSEEVARVGRLLDHQMAAEHRDR